MSSCSENLDFEQFDAGVMDVKPVQCGSIKKGDYMMLKKRPCKVIDYTTSKPGKHGSAKANITGIDIFTGKKYEDAFPTSATVYVPIVKKTELEVADIDEEGFVSLILADNSLKEDLKLPTDATLHDELLNIWEKNNDQAQVFFTVISACGEEKAIAGRVKEIF